MKNCKGIKDQKALRCVSDHQINSACDKKRIDPNSVMRETEDRVAAFKITRHIPQENGDRVKT